MPHKTSPYRESLLEALSDPVEAAHYLNAAMDDSPEMFLKALRNVAQARQMTKVAKDAGVTRESLYRALSEEGNPTLDTLHSVLGAMGLNIVVQATPDIVFVGSNFDIAPLTRATLLQTKSVAIDMDISGSETFNLNGNALSTVTCSSNVSANANGLVGFGNMSTEYRGPKAGVMLNPPEVLSQDSPIWGLMKSTTYRSEDL